MIPCADPRAQYLAYKEEIDAAIQGALNAGHYILGEDVRAFESEFADYVGAGFGIGVASGTDALKTALAACGVGAGDEVITVSHTAVATVAAIESIGAAPVLVDIDPGTFTLDPRQLDQALSGRVKAVVPVHLYGQPVHLDPILAFAKRHGLRVIEDCAQAHGAVYRGRRVGSWGDAGCFSFYPTKNLGAAGDGGMIVTQDESLAACARSLREYGWKERYVSDRPGWNSRLDELQAAILRVKLRHLDTENLARRKLAEAYQGALKGTELVLPRQAADTQHVYHLYVVRSGRRNALQEHLAGAGIGSLIHYPVPVHLQPAYSGRLRGEKALPETERAAREVLSLPMYPQLADADLRAIAAAIRRFEGLTA